MIKQLHIIFSVILTMVLLNVGSGVTLECCTHTGAVSQVTLHDDCCDLHDCDDTSHCMVVGHFQLSPTVSVKRTTVDFHVLQPVLIPLYNFVFRSPQLSLWDKRVFNMECQKWIPPRAYLKLLRTLQIWFFYYLYFICQKI